MFSPSSICVFEFFLSKVIYEFLIKLCIILHRAFRPFLFHASCPLVLGMEKGRGIGSAY
jgi:hypothetical protein